MIQKNTRFKVMEVFFKEPTSIHFIKELGRKVNVAPTSIRISIKELMKEGIIIIKKSNPFDGYVANRENDLFLFYKRAYNLYSLYKLKEELIGSLQPKAIILFGSYSRGEDVESSDIDLMIVSKVKKEINLKVLEKELERKINIMVIPDLDKLDKIIKNKVINGIVLHGEI